MKPPCSYSPDGITDVRVLDFEDFRGFRFEGDGLYSNCLVSDILRAGDFVEVASSLENTKYNSTLENSIYTHTVETFIPDISADLLSDLHLSTKRRYIVQFRGTSGRYFVFGKEAGAGVTYACQTSDGFGALVTFSALSCYPLFETSFKTGNYIRIVPTRMIIEKPVDNLSFILESSNPWKLISGVPQFVTLDQIEGNAGDFLITATSIKLGGEYITFQNEVTMQTATVYIANIDGRPWILEDGTWNELGFWYNTGLWNYKK